MDEVYIQKINEVSQFILGRLINMGASKEDAEDIVQETIYKYFLFVDSIQPNNAKSWMFKVSLNMFYDLVKKRRTEKGYFLNFHLDDLNTELTPEDIIVKKALAENVIDILERLNSTYKNLLILKYSTGLKYQEIADLLNMSVGNVKMNLFRARQNFIKEYGRIKNE
ncbi:RNA polymerase sigma factor [Bacillus sp. CGMCC 1.16607]|uniref:RNA polymerase sigma factor n=1 Tax=Bacillus sp. CGMCC 1.16607 TaxID=3351842 RepID=UPI0036394E69